MIPGQIHSPEGRRPQQTHHPIPGTRLQTSVCCRGTIAEPGSQSGPQSAVQDSGQVGCQSGSISMRTIEVSQSLTAEAVDRGLPVPAAICRRNAFAATAVLSSCESTRPLARTSRCGYAADRHREDHGEIVTWNHPAANSATDSSIRIAPESGGSSPGF